MTEEEARLENTSPGAPQSNEKPESQKSLTDKNSDLIAGTLKSQQTKEQKTMINEVNNFKSPPIPKDPKAAQDEYDKIKKVLIGPLPEWCLPRVNEKAQASSPTINDSALTHGCLG